ncbi:MAG: polysaccharide biosynthesis C-terminal domain-containing protein [Methanobrevibacter sp.]|jgi:Na+-driven multidrug efflux pump|nr:polysaccharide biosynthesis C-terminal domain-containing protein [Candidatus Methanovirga basalitermitum]
MFKRNFELTYAKYREFFLPTLLITASINITSVIDSIIIGNLIGPETLAATVLCVPIMTIITCIEMILGFGGSTVATIAKAEHKFLKTKQVFTTSILVLLIVGILMAIFGTVFLGDISNILSQGNQRLFQLVNDYLGFIFIGTPLMLLSLGFSYFIRAEGKPNLATMVFIVANVVNVIMDVVFIKYVNMGIMGGSLATLVGYCFGMVLIIRYLISKDRITQFTNKIGNIFKTLKSIFVLGLSPASGQIFMFLKILIINSLVIITIGSSGAVAMATCFDVLLIVSILVAGVCETFSPIVAVLYAEKDNNAVKFVMKHSFKIAIIISILITISIIILPNVIVQIYGITGSENINATIDALRIFSLSFVGVTITFIMLFYNQAIGQNKLSFLISICEGLLILIPVAYILSNIIGIYGIWISFSIAEITTILIILVSVKIISSKSKGKYKGFLLLEKSDDLEIFDLTIKGLNEVMTLSEKIIDFSKSKGLSEKTSVYLGMAIEEILVNIINYNNNQNNLINNQNKANNKKKHAFNKKKKLDFIDILIKIGKREVILSFKDSGIEYDPTVQSDDVQKFDNITVLKKISDKISYSKILGLNNTIITIKKTN